MLDNIKFCKHEKNKDKNWESYDNKDGTTTTTRGLFAVIKHDRSAMENMLQFTGNN